MCIRDRLYAAAVGFRPGVSDLGARSRAVGIARLPRVPLPLHPGGPRKGDGAAAVSYTHLQTRRIVFNGSIVQGIERGFPKP